MKSIIDCGMFSQNYCILSANDGRFFYPQPVFAALVILTGKALKPLTGGIRVPFIDTKTYRGKQVNYSHRESCLL